MTKLEHSIKYRKYQHNLYNYNVYVKFKLVRFAFTDLIKLIPNEWITDFHLDAYALYLYNSDGFLVKRCLFGINNYGLELNKLYDIKLLDGKFDCND